MSQISSINFKKSTDFQVFHNATFRPNYAIGGNLEYNLKGYEAKKLKEQIITKAKETYEKTIKQKFKAKSYEWSAVVNLKPDSTMADLEKLAKHFNEKYGFQCYQIAIHRDEGHLNEKGEKVINHHAHLEFITLDEKTGKNNYRRELITPSILRQIQSEVAEILQMQRGVDKRLSGTKRIEPRLYAKMKEDERAKIREIKAEALRVSQEQESEILALRAENNELKNTKDKEIENLKHSKIQLQEAENAISSIEKHLELETPKTWAETQNNILSAIDKKIALELAEKTRKHFKGKGLTQIFFKELSEIKKEVKVNKNAVLSEIKRKIHNLIKNHSNDYKAWFRSKIQQKQELQDMKKSLEQKKLQILNLAAEKQELINELYDEKQKNIIFTDKIYDLNAQICILSNEKEKKDTKPYLEQENRLETTLEQKNFHKKK